MVAARFRHTATLLEDGTVLIAGGKGAEFGILDTAEIFDPKCDPDPDDNPSCEPFTATGPMAKRRGVDHTATLVYVGYDDKVLLVGGQDPNPPVLGTPTADLYDPATKSFREAAGLLSGPRNFHTATPLVDGTVLITG